MAVKPTINVKKGNVAVFNTVPGRASNIAIIGAFDSEITDITSVSSARNAHSLFGTSTTYGTFKGTDVIDYLFIGAGNLVIANITTWTTSNNTKTANTTLTNDKLTQALTKLKGEEFDILFIAEELTDAAQTIVTTFLDEEAEHKNPHGQTIQLSKSTASAYATSLETLGDQTYYINTQTFTINKVTLDLNRSTALITGLIASMDVNESLTEKIIPNVTGVSPEYSTEDGELGESLLNLNIPFVTCKSRINNEYICLNSQLPNGYDIYINRVRDYVLKRIAVEVYLGKQSTGVTVGGIDNVVESVRQNCVEELNLLKDVIYSVEKTSSECIDIYIDSMVFYGIVTRINITYSIEVE